MGNTTNCFTANCDKCKNHILIKKNYWGDKIYTCNFYQKKHKAIDADDCGNFKCNTFDKGILCRDCRQTKVLSLKKR